MRQGCGMSPDLFSLYSQKVMDEMQDLEGVRVGGRNINNIRYADDTVLIADSEEKLQRLIDELQRACRDRGLTINLGPGKTEVMGLTKRNEDMPINITLEGTQITQVNRYIYLGTAITTDGRSGDEIVRRIGITKTTFNKMKKLLTNMSISMQTRLRLLKCFVWSVLLYGCEGWTLTERLKRRIEAMEMWCLRKMMRIPWTARMTNGRVMEVAGVKRELLGSIRARQLEFLGHLLRHDGLEKHVLLGKIDGRRARGRQRIKYVDSLLEDIPDNLRIGGLLQLAQDRERWRSMVAHVRKDMALR